jgi:type IV pilus assembly protein PilA
VIDRIKNRLASEQGFTLIELLVVIIILGILVAIAVPAYLSFTQQAHGAAAESNVRSAVPAAEDYFQTNTTLADSYKGMTGAALVSTSPGVDPHVVVSVSTDNLSYCIQDTSPSTATATASNTYYYIGGQDASKMGAQAATPDPGAGQVAAGACPALT